MKALSGSASFTVSSSPSITTTQFSNPNFTYPYSCKKPNSLSLSPSLIQFTKPKFTATVSTTETVEQDEEFDWFSHWYAIMPVCDLDKRAPHGKRVLGVDVVVWWDKNESAWKVFDDMCPHRLAPLSQGRINQWGRLQCVYHGWCFSGSGECKLIPQASPDGPPVNN
ncbi:putative pheophorbide a oxygenase [Helianthus debilis subsp. tardiflorus]